MNRGRTSGAPSAFIDTAAYFALADPSDNAHAAATAIARSLAIEHRRTYTTNFVLAETHALLLSRIGRATARTVLRAIDTSSTLIERVTPADEALARAIIDKYDDKNFSLTDATSFAIMERLGLIEVFTFDRNFTQYGFTVLSPV